jgi:hypothetical protein
MNLADTQLIRGGSWASIANRCAHPYIESEKTIRVGVRLVEETMSQEVNTYVSRGGSYYNTHLGCLSNIRNNNTPYFCNRTRGVRLVLEDTIPKPVAVINRGGSFESSQNHCKSSSRNFNSRDLQQHDVQTLDVGVRLVLEEDIPDDSVVPDKDVGRGGSWLNLPVNCRSATRYYNVAGFRSRYYGFRLVVDDALSKVKSTKENRVSIRGGTWINYSRLCSSSCRTGAIRQFSNCFSGFRLVLEQED